MLYNNDHNWYIPVIIIIESDININKLVEKYLIWKEIKKQIKILGNLDKKLSIIDQDLLKDHELIYFIGCGSSYHVGLIAKFAYDKLFDKNSICSTSSDFIIFPEIFIKNNSKRNKFFLISRTGFTTETLVAGKIIRNYLGKCISLVTSPNCELAKISDYSISLEEAKEKSITATVSVTSFTMILLSLIFKLSKNEQLIKELMIASNNFYKNFGMYSNYILSIINSENINKFIFLGAGPFYGVAKEAELKVKEMSITNAESCQPLEYRHGHKSILDKNSLVVIFLSGAGFDYELATAKEFRRIGAKVLIVCGNKKLKNLKDSYDYLIDINLNLEEILRPVFYQIFGQLLGYYQAVKKGIDPSNPRNLDFCVTLD